MPKIDIDSAPEALVAGTRDAPVVFHLAGTNRPEHESEFVTGTVGSLDPLFAAFDALTAAVGPAKKPVIVLSSSAQANQDSPYGRSKLAAEKALEAYASCTGTPAVIYRLPGVFGKWCRPHYNSVVATFCHGIARDLPITISDPARTLELVHVDGVVAQFITHLQTRTQASPEAKSSLFSAPLWATWAMGFVVSARCARRSR